jgi:hypothetical protein
MQKLSKMHFLTIWGHLQAIPNLIGNLQFLLYSEFYSKPSQVNFRIKILWFANCLIIISKMFNFSLIERNRCFKKLLNFISQILKIHFLWLGNLIYLTTLYNNLRPSRFVQIVVIFKQRILERILKVRERIISFLNL